MQNRLKPVIVLIIIHLILFTFFRALNYLSYYEIYKTLSISSTLIAFFDGLRFDISVFFTFSGIFLLFMLFPIKSKLWLKTLIFPIVILFDIYLGVLIADFIFFDNVKRHLSNEILFMKNDINFLLDYIKGDLSFILAGVILLLLNAYFIKKYFRFVRHGDFYHKLNIKSFSKNIVYILLFLTFAVFGVRGTPFGAPINLIDAFTRGSNNYGNLVLNGVFTAYHTTRAKTNSYKDYYDDETAFKKTSKFIREDYEVLVDDHFPLSRKIVTDQKRDEKKYNIAIILLESWSSEFIDSFSGNGYGVTPNIDKIYNESLVFKNFYANGQRSIYGITSTLLSIPQITRLPFLGRGLEVSNIFRVAKHFNDKDYYTIAVQSSARRSFRVSSITKALGFTEFYGREDMPIRFPYQAKEKPNFGWDYETFDFLLNKLNKNKTNPFFSFLFTGTTHEKFILPHKKFEKYPHKPYELTGFLNTLYYSDYSIGEFFKKAKKTKWFDNTIFFITADHCLGKFQKDTIKDKFNIPLLIYAPKIIKPGVVKKIGSQVDIIPTILDITGSKSSYTGIGKSLLRESNKRFVIINQGKVMSFLSDEGRISCIENRIISSNISHENKIEEMKSILFSIDQSIYKLIKNNRFYNF